MRHPTLFILLLFPPSLALFIAHTFTRHVKQHGQTWVAQKHKKFSNTWNPAGIVYLFTLHTADHTESRHGCEHTEQELQWNKYSEATLHFCLMKKYVNKGGGNLVKRKDLLHPAFYFSETHRDTLSLPPSYNLHPSNPFPPPLSKSDLASFKGQTAGMDRWFWRGKGQLQQEERRRQK